MSQSLSSSDKDFLRELFCIDGFAFPVERKERIVAVRNTNKSINVLHRCASKFRHSLIEEINTYEIKTTLLLEINGRTVCCRAVIHSAGTSTRYGTVLTSSFQFIFNFYFVIINAFTRSHHGILDRIELDRDESVETRLDSREEETNKQHRNLPYHCIVRSTGTSISKKNNSSDNSNGNGTAPASPYRS